MAQPLSLRAGRLQLTPRQQVFLVALCELCLSEGRAVHYSAVAQALRVNRFSAYDMLKVLEDKGYAIADYVLEGDTPGPGRSQVVFAPTLRGWACYRQPPDAVPDSALPWDEWQEIRDQLLERLRRTREAAYRDVIQELLARLPERRSSLACCTQLVAAFLLNLNRAKAHIAGVNPFDALAQLTADGDVGLGALAGLSLGSALAHADDRAERSLVAALFTGAAHYQRHLANINEESKRRLSEFAREVIGIFASQQAPG